MAFTVNDLQDFTLLLNRHPEWQAEVRRLVLTSELLALPDLVRELVEAQKRTDQRWERLSVAIIDSRESQQRTEQRLIRLEEGQASNEQHFGRLEAAMAELATAQAHTDEKMAELVVAQAHTDEKMAELVAAQARTDEKMAELVAAQTRTDEKMASLAATQEKFTQEMGQFRQVQEQLVNDVSDLKTDVVDLKTDVRNIRTDVAGLKTDIRNIKTDVAGLKTDVRGLKTDVRGLQGGAIHQKYIQFAPGYFGSLLRRVNVIWPGALEPALDDLLDEHLTREERADVLRLDGIIRGILPDVNRAELYLALEVSRTVEADDIMRVRRRAALLRKAGLRTLPVVAGESVSSEAQPLVQESPVVVVTNGHSEGWTETLELYT